MDKLRQTLLNAIEIKGTKRSDVAKQVGVSSSRVTEFLKDGQELSFDVVVNIVRILSPEKEFELLELYAQEVSNPKNIKLALEYSSTHRLLKPLKHLIEQSGKRNSSDLDKWSQAYKLLYTWQTISYESESSFYKDLRKHNINIPELNAIILLLECHVLRKLDQNETVKILSDIALEEIVKLKDGFIKKSLKCRLDEMLGIVELKVNCNYKQAEMHANNILEANNGNSYDGYAYYILGMCSLTEDFDRSLYYLNESISQYKKCDSFKNIKAIKGNVSLLHFYWCKINEKEDENDLYNLATQRSVDTSSLIKENQKHLVNTYLGKCLVGYSKSDKDTILESVSESLKSNDMYMAKIAHKKLEDLGEHAYIPKYVKNIINIA